ncbi:MAG: hypothetical protein PHQ24_03110 [Proteiniphilum sp.]|nr:hypothetical protein [Proteiniphilum sp.]
MGNHKIVGLTRGVYGKPGYLHASVRMTEEQDKEIARRIKERLKERGEERISNNEHWEITMEVLRETRKNE